MSNVYNYQLPRQILCLVGDSFEGRLPLLQLSRLLPFSSVPLSITFTFPPFPLQKLVKVGQPSISTHYSSYSYHNLGKCDCSFIRSRPVFVLTGQIGPVTNSPLIIKERLAGLEIFRFWSPGFADPCFTLIFVFRIST